MKLGFYEPTRLSCLGVVLICALVDLRFAVAEPSSVKTFEEQQALENSSDFRIYIEDVNDLHVMKPDTLGAKSVEELKSDLVSYKGKRDLLLLTTSKGWGDEKPSNEELELLFKGLGFKRVVIQAATGRSRDFGVTREALDSILESAPNSAITRPE